jgi:hypothetical protein
MPTTMYFTDVPGVPFLVIDHSVGQEGRNLAADVQLVQIMLNRAVSSRRAWFQHMTDSQGRSPSDVGASLLVQAKKELIVDETGTEIKPLNIDGVCGSRTRAAILAFQQAMKRVNGYAGVPDGRVNAISNPGKRLYVARKHAYQFADVDSKGHVTHVWLDDTRFYTMFLLCNESRENGNPLAIKDIAVEPLRSNLLKAQGA